MFFSEARVRQCVGALKGRTRQCVGAFEARTLKRYTEWAPWFFCSEARVRQCVGAFEARTRQGVDAFEARTLKRYTVGALCFLKRGARAPVSRRLRGAHDNSSVCLPPGWMHFGQKSPLSRTFLCASRTTAWYAIAYGERRSGTLWSRVSEIT